MLCSCMVSWGSSWAGMGNLGFLLSHCRGIGPHLKLRWGTRGSCWVEVRNSGFFSSCDGELGDPFELKQVSQSPSWGARGKSWFLSSGSTGNGSHFEMRWGTWCSSRVVVGSSGFLSSCDGYPGEPLKLQKGSQASFRVARGDSGFVSSRCRGIGPHFWLRWDLVVFINLCPGIRPGVIRSDILVSSGTLRRYFESPEMTLLPSKMSWICNSLNSLLYHVGWLRLELYIENCTFLSFFWEKELGKERWGNQWWKMTLRRGENFVGRWQIHPLALVSFVKTLWILIRLSKLPSHTMYNWKVLMTLEEIVLNWVVGMQ